MDNDILMKFGFRFGDKGTHTSRTIMLAEISALLQTCAPTATRIDYAQAIVESNCLGKRTLSTRQLTNQRLGELYCLDAGIPLFRIFRQLWYADESSRPLLALMICLARDPLLRQTANPIIRMRPGEELARQQLVDALTPNGISRFNDSTLDKVVRNVSSSWTQSGHLEGRSRKFRRQIKPTAIAAILALLLGHLEGARGNGLFDTQWTKLLDSSTDGLIYLAMDAKRRGLLEVRNAGGIIDILFDQLLTDDEKRIAYVAN